MEVRFGEQPSVVVDAEKLIADVADVNGIDLSGAETPPKTRKFGVSVVVVADAVALSIALLFGQLTDLEINRAGSVGASFESLMYVPVLLLAMSCYGLYRDRRRRLIGTSFPDVGPLLNSLVVGSLGVLLLAAGLHRWLGLPNVDRTAIAVSGLAAVVTVVQGRAVARWYGWHWRRGLSRVLVVGSGVVATNVVSRLRKAEGVIVVGCADDNEGPTGAPCYEIPLLGGLDDIPRIVADEKVDHVVVAFSQATGARLADLLRTQSPHIRISVVPRLFDLMTVRSHVDEVFGLPVIDVAPASFGNADRVAKRAMDICGAGIGLLILAPAMILIAAAIKLTSRGPVLFKQERIGRRNTRFAICKFRTMQVGAEKLRVDMTNDVDGPLFKSHNDPRVTKVGKFLRSTSLDELPQLLNVFKGDMSLVGPRPFVTSESGEIGGWATRRFDVRPGMTGLWQVSGRNDLPFAELCRLDYSYVASWSLWWDIRILWHTPGIVFRRSGAY